MKGVVTDNTREVSSMEVSHGQPLAMQNDGLPTTKPRVRTAADASRRVMWILLTSGIVVLSIKYMTEYGLLGRIAQHLGAPKQPSAMAPAALQDYTTTEKLKQMMIAMGVRIYGSDTCPWSKKQIQDLSIDPNDSRLFVDCEKRPTEATGIEAYPSWKTKKGKVMVGYLDANRAIAALQAELYESYDKATEAASVVAKPEAAAPAKTQPPQSVVEILDSDDDTVERGAEINQEQGTTRAEMKQEQEPKKEVDLKTVKKEKTATTTTKPKSKPEKSRTVTLGVAPEKTLPITSIVGEKAAAALSAGAVEAVNGNMSGDSKKDD